MRGPSARARKLAARRPRSLGLWQPGAWQDAVYIDPPVASHVLSRGAVVIKPAANAIAPEQLVRTIETLLKRKVEPGTALGEAWAVTDALGDILEISAEAAKMLNLSARGLRGRNLPAFITDNRPRLLSELLRASEGLLIDRMSTLQPRDRRPMRVHLDVSALPADAGERVRLRWILSPESR